MAVFFGFPHKGLQVAMQFEVCHNSSENQRIHSETGKIYHGIPIALVKFSNVPRFCVSMG
jgi:hypothetical protein